MEVQDVFILNNTVYGKRIGCEGEYTVHCQQSGI